MKLFSLLFATALLVLGAIDTRAAATWLNDLPAAQARAQAEGKLVLVNFTGSDWCGWCLKLRKDVFLKPEFESYARTNFILVEVDFPKRKPQPPQLQQANQKLAEQFQAQTYPTLVLLDPRGAILGKINYANGGVKAFRAEVEKVLHPAPELVPQQAAVRSNAPPRRGEKVSPGKTNAPAELVLSKITGSKRKRQAVINNQTLATGQSTTFNLTTGTVKVSCVEIRDRSVIVNINGRKERRELRLANGI